MLSQVIIIQYSSINIIEYHQ